MVQRTVPLSFKSASALLCELMNLCKDNAHIVTRVYAAPNTIARDALCACQELLVYTRRTEQVEALWLTETAQICTYAWMSRAS